MTTTIYRGEECRHQSADHSSWGGAGSSGMGPRVGPCSYGGCACSLTPDQVEERYPAVKIPTFPGYDRKTQRWARSEPTR